MLFGSKQRLVRADNPVLSLSGTTLEFTQFDCAMTWHDHIDAIASKVSKSLDSLVELENTVM